MSKLLSKGPKILKASGGAGPLPKNLAYTNKDNNFSRLVCNRNPNLTTVKISQTLQDTIDITKDDRTTIEWV